eukprot:CAMPEP_0113680628 /NCGR_PEP_ID=MMETSP0038_2-20120614/11451_1 /TAXON_ID=2898 /ORGANISM="Cryptomonas paramecium" /LENGTH=346 /DNA_ID=CAMNT_0000599083 /DNA_START=68 /DNA_END=1108 /DNA_ORIENTATION=- /assembly_acc=CAM_ASM_000170
MTWGEQNTEEESHKQLDYALRKGVNFIDTAEMYPVPTKAETTGRTEEYIGRWLAKGGQSLRSKIVLASKVSGYCERPWIVANRTVPPGEGKNPRLFREQILAACDGSLRRLQTNYLDLYQLHWPDRYSAVFGSLAYERRLERPDFAPFDEQVLAMGELMKAGKIRHWGISNENAFGVARFVEAAGRLGVPLPVSIQNDFSMLYRKFEQDGTAEACSPLHTGQDGGIALLAYGPLAGGTLSDKYSMSGEAVARCRHVLYPTFQRRYHSEASLEAASRFASVAKRHGLTPAQLALAWTAGREYVGAVIIGATSQEQLEENISAFDVELSKECLEEVDKVLIFNAGRLR